MTFNVYIVRLGSLEFTVVAKDFEDAREWARTDAVRGAKSPVAISAIMQLANGYYLTRHAAHDALVAVAAGAAEVQS